ncbi:MAG: type 1 glutamine amidotransferase [Desulfobacterales bacterium]|nr:type 1 glutamine amidotransferase [Desulfobacterales bacterium]
MKAHILQQVPFEGIGSIQSWLTAQNASIHCTRFYESPILPDITDIDLIIVMGGPMSVNDVSSFPWLEAEKQFIHEAIRVKKSVVGICLGAQIIASALGARVYPGPQKEIGWFDIEASSDDTTGLFRFPEKTTVFHWHGETFDLPPGAARLAKSSVCENQAFQVGKNVIGLQFHLETTPEALDLIIRNCGDELTDAEYIQKEPDMRAIPQKQYTIINQLMHEILAYVTQA